MEPTLPPATAEPAPTPVAPAEQPQTPPAVPPTPDLSWVPPKRPSRRRGALARLGGIAVIAVVALGFGAFRLLTSDKGHVVFTLSEPKVDNCEVKDTTKTAATTDQIYFVGIMQHHQDGKEAMKLVVSGPAGEGYEDEMAPDNIPYDCLTVPDPIGPAPAGDYTVKFTKPDGSVEAEGTITVK